MNGHIEKRSSKDGKPRWTVHVVYQGKRRQVGSFELKKEADAHLRRVQREIADGTFGLVQEKVPSFKEHYDRWIAGKEKSLKPATFVDYEHTFRNHILPFYGYRWVEQGKGKGKTKKMITDPKKDITIDKLSPQGVQDFINSLETKPATTQKIYRYYRACIKQAVTWGVIEKNPCVGIQLPRANKEELVYLQPEEIAVLLPECREQERVLFTLLAFSGLRLGEGLALRWLDIDFEMGAIKVMRSYSILNGFTEPKTAAGRRAVPLFPTLTDVLMKYYKEQGEPTPDALLFTENGETPLDKGNCRRRFYAALEAAKLKHVSIHSLRHTFASVMLASGASVKALATCVGHSTPSVTLNTYSHMISESVEPVLLKADALMTGANGKLVRLDDKRVKREKVRP